MRIPAYFRHLFLLLVVASPTLVRAQFQPPTPEELSMTADPKAPGAAAVFLNVEEITDDPIHFHSFYARIKILTEKGKELATVEVPYRYGDFKVEDIKARTIHADGTVIPLVGKPEDLLGIKMKSKNGDLQVNRRVFNLPSVEVGSILEYRYSIRYDDNTSSSPTWDIQRPYFVHHAHYSFTPFDAFIPSKQQANTHTLVDAHGNALNTLISWYVLPPGVTVKADATGRYKIDLSDIPPIPDEDGMPPLKSILYQVRFYYSKAGDLGDFWVTEGKRWSREVDHFAEPSKPIKEAVARLTAPGDSDLDKAKKLYTAVQALDNTDFSRKKSEFELKQLKLKVAKTAEDTWAQKSGSSQDIALLYLALLRAAGLTAYEMKVVDREQGVFSPGYLDFDQLDDDIVILSIAGKEIVLDPGEKMCPFQMVHWRHSGANGIRQNAKSRDIWTSPYLPFTANTLLRTGDLTLDSHGVVTGSIHFVMTGQEALRWRQAGLRNDLDEVKKQFDHELESIVPDGVEAHVDHFLGIDDPDVNLIAKVNLHGTLGTATAKRILLPGFFFETRGGHPFVNQEKRQEAVDMHYGDVTVEQIAYHLPNGFTVEGAPPDSKISWFGHAVYVSKSVTAPNQITVARQLGRAFTEAKPEEYQDLRGFYQKVAAADQAQLVLTRAPAAAKGN
jgi:hypothetical protein